jgi:hypothetical protein
MASEFSSYLTSPKCTDHHNNPLTHSPCVSSSSYFPLDIPTPNSTILLIHLFIATTTHHCSTYISYPFMKPRRMAPVRSWRNQGGLA